MWPRRGVCRTATTCSLSTPDQCTSQRCKPCDGVARTDRCRWRQCSDTTPARRACAITVRSRPLRSVYATATPPRQSRPSMLPVRLAPRCSARPPPRRAVLSTPCATLCCCRARYCIRRLPLVNVLHGSLFEMQLKERKQSIKSNPSGKKKRSFLNPFFFSKITGLWYSVWLGGAVSRTQIAGETSGDSAARWHEHSALDRVPVSYTHLTLPTIYSV